MKTWPVFICYRQSDGMSAADFVYSLLHEQALSSVGNNKSQDEELLIDAYFDQAAPSVGNFTEIHEPHLKRSRAIIVVCSPGAKIHEGGNDWVHREIDWWLANRSTAPILIDPLGQGNRYVPDSITDKWPNAQRIELPLHDLDDLDEIALDKVRVRTRERLIGGIVPSGENIYRQELEEEKQRIEEIKKQQKLNRKHQAWIGRILAGTTIAVMFFIVLAIKEKRDTAREISQFLSSTALQVLRSNSGDRSLRLAILASRSNWLQPVHHLAEVALASAASSVRLQHVLRGHSGAITSCIYSDDGKKILTASRDGTAILWEVESGKPIGNPMKHDASVNVAIFSPDGTSIITGSDDYTVRLWSSTNGMAIGHPIKQDRRVKNILVNFTGTRLVTTVRNHNVNSFKLWDVKSGKAVDTVLEHQGRINHIEFSPNGDRVVSASDDKTAQIWSSETGKAVGAPMQHSGRVVYAAFSPDGSRVVTASYDGTAQLWNGCDGTPIGSPMDYGENLVEKAFFSPNGRQILTIATFGDVRIWDGSDGTFLYHIDESRDKRFVQFSPDSNLIVTVINKKAENAIQLWDSSDGSKIGSPMNHNLNIWHVSFNHDSSSIVTTSRDKTAIIWDSKNGKSIGSPILHDDRVSFAVLSPNGKQMTTVSEEDPDIRLWKTVYQNSLVSPLDQYGFIFDAEFSPLDGELIVTGGASREVGGKSRGEVRFFNGHTGESVGPSLKLAGNDSVSKTRFSSDGKWIITANRYTAHLIDVESKSFSGLYVSHDNNICDVAFTPDGSSFVTASNANAKIVSTDTMVSNGMEADHENIDLGGSLCYAIFNKDNKLLAAVSGEDLANEMNKKGKILTFRNINYDKGATPQSISEKVVKLLLEGLSFLNSIWSKDSNPRIILDEDVKSISFNKDTSKYATVTNSGQVKIWDRPTGSETPIGESINCFGDCYVAFNSDSTRLVTLGYTANHARLWDVVTGDPVGLPLKHEILGVDHAEFSPDGTRLVTTNGSEVQLWDAFSGELIGFPLKIKSDGFVEFVVFSPDNTRLLAAGLDTINLWNVSLETKYHGEELLKRVCEHWPPSVTTVTRQDISITPILSGKEGFDVCAGYRSNF